MPRKLKKKKKRTLVPTVVVNVRIRHLVITLLLYYKFISHGADERVYSLPPSQTTLLSAMLIQIKSKPDPFMRQDKVITGEKRGFSSGVGALSNRYMDVSSKSQEWCLWKCGPQATL